MRLATVEAIRTIIGPIYLMKAAWARHASLARRTFVGSGAWRVHRAGVNLFGFNHWRLLGRRLRRRQGRRRWAGVGGRGILVTMEEAGSEDHQRMFHHLQDQLITGHQVRAAGKLLKFRGSKIFFSS